VSVAGPIGSVLAPGRGLAAYADLAFASSLCGSCSDVCPVRVDLHRLLLAWRRRAAAQGALPLGKRAAMRVAGAVMQRAWLYRLVGKAMRTVVPVLPRAAVYNRFNTWGQQRELPVMPRRSFREIYAERYGK
jgi:L-lactate dehydrogenase complex protein LldF